MVQDQIFQAFHRNLFLLLLEIFEEPVTLETGQTFQRKAIIKAWFEKGNRTCPVTGNDLSNYSTSLHKTFFYVVLVYGRVR